MADEDFDLDVYADANNDNQGDGRQDEAGHADVYDEGGGDGGHESQYDGHGDYRDEHMDDGRQSSTSTLSARPPQGVKRKEPDDRPTDPGATTALMISELNWWVTDDQVRGWARQANCEGELKDITFSEHKVNGKSKG
jgi:hypothetical protein